MVSLARVLEAVYAEGEPKGVSWQPKPLIRSSVDEALSIGRLRGIPGVYVLLSSDPDERMLFLGSSDDIERDLQRHAKGETSALLERLVTQGAKYTMLEALPSSKDVVERIYQAVRRVLVDEFEVSLPLNPEK